MINVAFPHTVYEINTVNPSENQVFRVLAGWVSEKVQSIRWVISLSVVWQHKCNQQK